VGVVNVSLEIGNFVRYVDTEPHGWLKRVRRLGDAK
jgi:hypothetical protein